MRRPRRFWAWTLTITSALLAVVWVGSMKTWARAFVRGRVAAITCDGCLTVTWNDMRQRQPWGVEFSVQPSWSPPDWRFRVDEMAHSGGVLVTFVQFPLWPFVLLTGVPGVWMLIKTRTRTNPNACPACGYDRTGLPQTSTGPAACPECGPECGKSA